MTSVFRTNNFRKGLIGALENLEEDAPVEAPLEADGADTAIIEATEVASDIDAGVAEVESTQDDAATLGDIADTIEASEETGGLDPVAAEVTQVAVEAIYARLGVTRSQQPALEGFADKNSRVKFTRVAVEDIRATIKKAWLAVINAFQSIKQWVINFFKAIFDANEKILQRAKSLEAKAKATKGTSTAKDGKIDAGGVVKALSGGKLDKAGAIAVVEGGAELAKGAQSVAGSAVQKFDVKAVIEDAAKFDAFTVPAFPTSGVNKPMKKDAPEGMQWTTVSGGQKNGKLVALLVPSAETKGAPAFAVLSKLQVQVVAGGGEDGGEGGSSLEVLTVEEASKVIAAAAATAKAVITAKAAVTRVESLMDAYIADAKAAAQVSESEGASGRSSAARSAITAQSNMVAKGTTALLKEATSVAKAGLDYAEKSLATYKEAEATEGDKKPADGAAK